MKIKIVSLGTRKTITTKYGEKDKLSYKIKTQDGKEMWVGVWANKDTVWNVNDVVEIKDLKPNEYNGKTYYDIVMPRPEDKIYDLEKRVAILENKLLLGTKVDKKIDDSIPF